MGDRMDSHLDYWEPPRPPQHCCDVAYDQFHNAIQAYVSEQGKHSRRAAFASHHLQRRHCGAYIGYNHLQRCLDVSVYYGTKVKNVIKGIRVINEDLPVEDGNALINGMHELDRPIVGAELVGEYVDHCRANGDVVNCVRVPRGADGELIQRIIREAKEFRIHLKAIYDDIVAGTLGSRRYSHVPDPLREG